MHPNQPLSPTTTQWLGNHTLVNSNLHQPLISFLYMIPSCTWNHIEKMYKRDAKYEVTSTRIWLLNKVLL